VLLPTGGGLQPLRPVRAHRPTVDARAVCRALIAPSSWVEEGSDDRSRARRLQLREEPQFEELSPRSTPQQREWPVSFADPEEPSAPTTSSFFDDDEDDLFDPFALPPAPEKVREGELGETRDETANGRTEGFYAALAEAPDRLRAADLNEVLQPDHLDRLRFTNFPLQAYGALFKWEVLVRDVLDAYRRPWEIVAEENGFAPPEDDEVLRAVGMRPERAIMQTFMWTDDWGLTQRMAYEHYEAMTRVMTEHEFVPADGVVEWLTLLKEYQVPCCVCAGTSLNRPMAEAALQVAGLSPFFEAYTTAEDDCETPLQTYLVSSIKLRRPPERCVVFEDDPKGVVAAHEASAKAVAIMGGASHGADLRVADIRVGGFDDLTLMSLRNLFRDARAM